MSSFENLSFSGVNAVLQQASNQFGSFRIVVNSTENGHVVSVNTELVPDALLGLGTHRTLPGKALQLALIDLTARIEQIESKSTLEGRRQKLTALLAENMAAQKTAVEENADWNDVAKFAVQVSRILAELASLSDEMHEDGDEDEDDDY